MKTIIIAAIALLMLCGGAAGGYFGGHYLAPPGKPAIVPLTEKEPALEAAKANFYDFPEVFVMLKGSENQGRLLRLAVSIEYRSGIDPTQLQAYVPRILDTLQVYLRAVTVGELRGREGLARLRAELLRRIDAQIAPMAAQSVLLRTVSIQ